MPRSCTQATFEPPSSLCNRIGLLSSDALLQVSKRHCHDNCHRGHLRLFCGSCCLFHIARTYRAGNCPPCSHVFSSFIACVGFYRLLAGQVWEFDHDRPTESVIMIRRGNGVEIGQIRKHPRVVLLHIPIVDERFAPKPRLVSLRSDKPLSREANPAAFGTAATGFRPIIPTCKSGISGQTEYCTKWSYFADAAVRASSAGTPARSGPYIKSTVAISASGRGLFHCLL